MDDLALQYHGAMEFIALQTRHIIDTMNKAGHDITSIFMSGGQCKNKLLMALIANATGLPVCIPSYIDAAVVLGAAMLGAKAASRREDGTTDGLWDIMDRMSKPGRVVYPTEVEGEKKLLEAKYKASDGLNGEMILKLTVRIGVFEHGSGSAGLSGAGE